MTEEIRQLSETIKRRLQEDGLFEKDGMRVELVRTPGRHTYRVSCEQEPAFNQEKLGFGQAVSEFLYGRALLRKGKMGDWVEAQSS